MLKDHFQKSTSTLNNLRSQHFKVSEYLNKGKYRLKQKFFGKGKKHYDFDINSQQFFHEYIDDIIFEQTDIQQIFYSHINKSMEHPIIFNNKNKIKDNNNIKIRKNPSQVRVILARHFKNRVTDLQYKKYLTLLRYHNLDQQQHITALKSRTNLIQKQIQQCLHRLTRLQIQDYFQSSYCQGGKPIPVNQNQQPIYKYLDEQQCWFSNIHRQDIIAYLRNTMYKQDILSKIYWPYYYQFKYLTFVHGLTITNKIQTQLNNKYDINKQNVINTAKKLINILQKGLQGISPGNLQQKQNISNFIYMIYGVTNDNPISIPFYPATYVQLCDNYNKISNVFFNTLTVNSHKDIIQIIPKFNSFCSILFKYQNQQILQGEKQIKLGLDDQIDIKKQLVTMLQEQWVTRYVKIDYKRYQYRMDIKCVDWVMDTYSMRMENEMKIDRQNQNGYAYDFSLKELIHSIRLTTYGQFRKIMRRRSEKITDRLGTKYEDMEQVQKYSKKSDEEINMEKLSDLYKTKMMDMQQVNRGTILKQNTNKFFKLIIKDFLITNPVEIQMAKSLTCIKIRQTRTKSLNILNAMRCYQRNINLDLRVINGCQFKFQLDDQFLINSNKQTIDKFQKHIKQTQTTYSSAPHLDNQDFILHGQLQKQQIYKKDKVYKQFYNDTIPHLLVLDGRKCKNIIYDIVLQDIKILEHRILEIGTHFINRYQRIIKMRNLAEIVDRISILNQIFQYELEYLYEKFNLIQNYYNIYENTVQPLNAHKIAKIIIQIMYSKPKIDYNANNYTNSYRFAIDALKQENKLIKTFTKMVQNQQYQHNKIFHKKFANLCQIPLTLWAYAYGDIEVKGGKNYNKLQRMNSVSSKMSRNSQKSQKNNISQIRQQIRQQFGQYEQQEQRSYYGQQQDKINIEQYDGYMLRRNMDDIFEDIVGGVEAGKEAYKQAHKQQKQKGTGLGTSSLGLQNITVNPKFQGGPHTLHNYLPDIKVTSSHTQKLLNFAQNICVIANIHYLIKQLIQQCRNMYGYCNEEYQICLYKNICMMMNDILLSPLTISTKPQKIYEQQTDDIYLETVIKDIKQFQQIFQPILDLPSPLQLAIQSTHDKHQNTLPHTQLLLNYDINILSNLVKLQKPCNTAAYRQLNLSINLVQFIRLRDRIYHIQMERQQVYIGYKALGQYCDIPIDKYTNCYGRSGQSEIFMACSEGKVYSDTFLKRPSYNDSIEELRVYYELEQAELKLFYDSVRIAKLEIEDYIRLTWNIERDHRNALINRSEILISNDKKNVKMVTNRVKGHANYVAGQILKTKCFLKQKLKMRTILQEKIKLIGDMNIEQIIWKVYLNNDTKKYNNKNCILILAQKIKKLLLQQYIKNYTKDIKQNQTNNSILIELLLQIQKIRNYTNSLPYLSKLLTIPTQFQALNKKVFYDQKKIPIIEQVHNLQTEGICYIESKEQVLENWEALQQNTSVNNIVVEINVEQFVRSMLPPQSKNELFKWIFKIPANNVVEKDKQAMRHLLKLYEPYTGKISVSEYRCGTVQLPSRNKFMTLYEKYATVIEYIQANFMVISLQLDDDILDSIISIVEHGYKFEERYPLVDEAAIYESDPKSSTNDDSNNKQAVYLKDSIMAPCFIYENRKDQLQKKLKIKINSRGYVENKIHWAVIDEKLDFIISKVQGYGVIRHCFLELRDQITQLAKLKPQSALTYMKSKTQNIYFMMWLSLWQTFSSQNNQIANVYTPIFLDYVVPVPKKQEMKTPLNLNQRRGISNIIEAGQDEQQQQKYKYNIGVYQLKNNYLINKLKIPYNFLPIDVGDYVENCVYKSENQLSQKQQSKQSRQKEKQKQNQLYVLRHNQRNFNDFKILIKQPGKQFRYRLFARIRQYFQLAKTFISTKSQTSQIPKLMQLQQKKSVYLQYLMQAKIYMIALSAFKLSKYCQSFPDSPSKLWEQFDEQVITNKEIIQLSTYNIYDQLQAYEDSGRIVFSKTQSSLISTNVKNIKLLEENNKIVRSVISSKLICQQFKHEVLEVAIRLLTAQKLPKQEQKKIQNTSLIPRVHLISSFSSPLITDRKTYISQQYKLAFVQAFINRFRNKVSRVDLLSSGYGFVITVPDLQDCVNFMNKLLFTFTEKEFKTRLETFSQYYQIMIDGIRSRNAIIGQQKAIIKYLQDKVNNTLQAEYLSKVSKLLQEKVLIEEKLRLAEQTSNGLQHRVRKTVQHQYDLRITSLQKQNGQLRSKFEQFKDLLIKLTKDTTKMNFLTLVNQLKQQVSSTLDKKIDLSESFKNIRDLQVQSTNKKINVKQQASSHNKQHQKQQQKQYDQQDIQKCKIGQDIIHDPYYVTKLINKMRAFNLFKMGAKRIKHQNKEEHKIHQLTSLHKIQDRVIAQNQREVVIRDELIRAQEELSKKSVQLDKVKHLIESLENQKAKLKILLISKQKKIQQKQRQNQQFKKKIQDKTQKQGAKIQSKANLDIGDRGGQDELPKLSSIRQQRKSRKKIQKDMFLTNLEDRSAAISLYEKFELSNKDSTWRQKCEQLYLENKKLLNEIQKYKQGISGTVTPHTRQGYSLNMRNKRSGEASQRETSRSDKRKFPNLSFKYGVMKGGLN